MEDRHLLSLLWEHAENAIFEMSRRFGARLHATALNLTGSRMDAEECVNDTYMAVWDSIPPIIRYLWLLTSFGSGATSP